MRQIGGKHLTSEDYCYARLMQVQTSMFLLYILQHFGGISFLCETEEMLVMLSRQFDMFISDL